MHRSVQRWRLHFLFLSQNMSIPTSIKIKNNELPEQPGVYFYFDNEDKLLYIGKATSLKARVSSYFNGAHNARLSELVSKIARIDYIVTENTIQALVLEANQVRAHRPSYNVMLKDDKSFLYLVITNEDFPKPLRS
jgi:excinuclease ABC subunit C